MLLIDRQTGLPHPHAARYVLSVMRSRGISPNTMRPRLRAIATGLIFLHELHIVWPDRVLKGQFLDYWEALALRERFRVDQRSGTQTVRSAVACNAFRGVLSYLVWLARPLIAGVTDAERQLYLGHLFDDFRRMAHELARDTSSAGIMDAAGLGMAESQRELFLKAITPGTPENPFSPRHQHRNQALLMLQYATGCRAGEVLALKIRDISFSAAPATVTFHRRHNDPEDPRSRQPVAKTRARILEIADDLRSLLESWILEHRCDRARYPSARKHPFLAVNRFGAPLSQRGYERIFYALRRRHPSLEKLVSHLLRHDWNDRFLTLADADGENPSDVEKEQIYAMGWSDHSKMPQRYGRRAIRRSVGKKMLRMLDRAFKGIPT